MNIPFRSLLLTLTLALSMAAGAVMHGMALAAPAHDQSALLEIVICADGPVDAIITVDRNGNRVDPAQKGCPPQPCPDCLGIAAFALPPVQPVQVRAASARRVTPFVAGLTHPERPYAHFAARGPPQKV